MKPSGGITVVELTVLEDGKVYQDDDL